MWLSHPYVNMNMKSLGALWSNLKPKQLMSSLHHCGDFVAAADGLVDLLRGVHLHTVNLHHHVSR